MSDFPEDIDWIATNIVRALYSSDQDPEWEEYKAIASALLAEREHSAKICDDFAIDSWGHTELEYAGQTLADAIRNPQSAAPPKAPAADSPETNPSTSPGSQSPSKQPQHNAGESEQ